MRLRTLLLASVLLMTQSVLSNIPNVRAAPIALKWFHFDPAVISATSSSPVELKVKIEGTPSTVQLRLSNGPLISCSSLLLAGGPTVSLSDESGGIWGTVLTASEALSGYVADRVNHNFVGCLEVYEDGSLTVDRLMVINVLDENIPAVTATSIGPLIQRTSHLVNIWKPDLNTDNPGSQIAGITAEFYGLGGFEDNFDFINIVFSLPSFPANRHHFAVQNGVMGIGLPLFNNGDLYGSTGQLQGISVFPIDSLFDMAETGAVHELGHQWINYLGLPIVASGSPHWPISSLSRGIMGFSSGADKEGSRFPFDLVALPDGSYMLVSSQSGSKATRQFTDMDLYLMGLLPPDQVGSHLVFVNQNQLDQVHNGGILQGPVDTVGVEDVIGLEGPRVPDASISPKGFRAATIVVTNERLLTEDEMSFFDHFSARGDRIETLPFSSGLETGTTEPFFLATGEKGFLSTCVASPTLAFGECPPDTRFIHVIDGDGTQLTNGGVTGSNVIFITYEGRDPEFATIVAFECSLDGAPFSNCAQPPPFMVIYPPPTTVECLGLSPGDHTFRVRAVNEAFARDSEPASFSWSVTSVSAGASSCRPFFDRDFGPSGFTPDGIEELIDTDPTAFSNSFSDVALGGTTSGSIIDRGSQQLLVAEEPKPSGVRVIALLPDLAVSPTPATITACVPGATITLTAGDAAVITCSSLTVQALRGVIEIRLANSDGTFETAALAAPNTLTFDPSTFRFVASSDNLGDVLILIGGNRVSLAPGQRIDLKTVRIDIRPGSDRNVVSVESKGVIPVAILTTRTFNAATIDPSTVRFGRIGSEASPAHVGLEDVDGDGRIDLILQFKLQQTGIGLGDMKAILVGRSLGGDLIEGIDSVEVLA